MIAQAEAGLEQTVTFVNQFTLPCISFDKRTDSPSDRPHNGNHQHRAFAASCRKG
ncbi:hypothetical protein [Thiomonas sp.]